eukprot:scaffold109133_cov28-Tisochrysis_lutea.AAC.2
MEGATAPRGSPPPPRPGLVRRPFAESDPVCRAAAAPSQDSGSNGGSARRPVMSKRNRRRKSSDSDRRRSISILGVSALSGHDSKTRRRSSSHAESGLRAAPT